MLTGSADRQIKQVALLASSSRLLVFVVQVIGNLLVPDHHADAFNPPIASLSPSASWPQKAVYTVVDLLIGGFRRWDGVQFLHIAQFGYIFEHSAAFFPLYPILTRSFAKLIVLPLSFGLVTDEHALLASGLALNFVFFNLASVYLYRLTMLLFKDKKQALVACFIFSINPAGVFFSAPYSESLYSFLTFSALFYLYSGKLVASVLLFSLSSLCRSNGLMNAGFLAYFISKRYLVAKNFSLKTLQDKGLSSAFSLVFSLDFVKTLLQVLAAILPIVSAFLGYQYYIFSKLCFHNDSSQLVLPEELAQYALDNQLPFSNSPGDQLKLDLCAQSLPLSYTYVQAKYWNVGFFKYWQLKQAPNFILAVPILYLSITCIAAFFQRAKGSIWNLFNLFGLLDGPVKVKHKNCEASPKDPEPQNSLFPFIVHLMSLVVSSLFFMHVQVSTRFITSSSPVIYWYLSSGFKEMKLGSRYLENIKLVPFIRRLLNENKNKWTKRCVLYMVSYIMIGTVLFVNFLPFT